MKFSSFAFFHSHKADILKGNSFVWWQQASVLMLTGGIVMGLARGVRHVQGLFLVPITMDRGWSRETFGLAMAVQNLIWGIAQPLSGMIADRFGSAKVIAGGLVFYAIGLMLMSQAATPSVFIWSAGVCIGIALSGTSFGAVYGALSRLAAPERRSWRSDWRGQLADSGSSPWCQLHMASWVPGVGVERWPC